MSKPYHEKVIDEIIDLIKDNLILQYNFQDDALKCIRDYSKIHAHKRYKPMTYEMLMYLTENALSELINAPYLIDFRNLE